MINLSKIKNINHLWGTLIIEELVRCGVDYFCISPGSRSTPLVIGAAENSKVSSCIHYDERGLAYLALGYTSSSGKPACLIATSGTAVANFFPAVIEASKKKLPLIILTADRPPELRNTGANQTIDQVKIYGDYVRFSFDMPCPTGDILPEMVLTTIDQAVYRSMGNPPGPVHINCMFREPLAPSQDKYFSKNIVTSIEKWAKESSPFTKYLSYEKRLTENVINKISKEIKQIKKGIIAVGKLKTEEEKESVIKIAQILNWPVFPDITSGIRLESNDKRVIHYFDQVLLGPGAVKNYAPDGVLHFGGRLTSKRWYDFIEVVKPEKYIMVLNHPLRNDPLHCVTLRIESPVSHFCESIEGFLEEREDNTYVSNLKKASEKAAKSIEKFNTEQKVLSAVSITQVIVNTTSVKTGLFLASSMSIRIMDMFAGTNKNLFLVGSNRGASGIDGTLATAAGFAKGINKPCVLLIGDLAFLHDLNSLALVKPLKHPFIIIVLNDNGGSLFSFLPIASFPKVFEKYFATPHGFNFESAGKMFGITYFNPVDTKGFAEKYKKALKDNSPAIIEIRLNRNNNFKAIKSLQNEIISELKKRGKNEKQ